MGSIQRALYVIAQPSVDPLGLCFGLCPDIAAGTATHLGEESPREEPKNDDPFEASLLLFRTLTYAKMRPSCVLKRGSDISV